jgi:hypothetical protein
LQEKKMIPQLSWLMKLNEPLDQPDSSAKSAELEMRGSFFRQQWETVGPGLLNSVCARLRAANPLPITIQLKLPVGAPAACAIDGQQCQCDALLHDVDSRLSETFRLTWAIATCLVHQSRNGVVAAQPATKLFAPENVSNELVAAGLTLKSGMDLGVLGSHSQEVVELANSLWGLQLEQSEFEWLQDVVKS